MLVGDAGFETESLVNSVTEICGRRPKYVSAYLDTIRIAIFLNHNFLTSCWVAVTRDNLFMKAEPVVTMAT